jgi:hypothetical protein
MARTDAKSRRAPYRRLPDNIAANGFVADLVSAVTAAAESMGQPVRFFRKNADWFVGVAIPNRAELDKIEADTEAAVRIAPQEEAVD